MTLHILKGIPHPPGTQNANLAFIFIIFYSSLCSLKSMISGKLRNTNIGDLHLANTLGILEINNLSFGSLGKGESSFLQRILCQISSGRSCVSAVNNYALLFNQLRLGQSPVLIRCWPARFLMYKMLVKHQNQLQQGFTLKLR